jgi:hypothetical protein
MNPTTNATHHRPELSSLVELIQTIVPARRGAALLCAISFRPIPTLEPEFAIGPLRAAFAHYWEQWLFDDTDCPKPRTISLPVGQTVKLCSD